MYGKGAVYSSYRNLDICSDLSTAGIKRIIKQISENDSQVIIIDRNSGFVKFQIGVQSDTLGFCLKQQVAYKGIYNEISCINSTIAWFEVVHNLFRIRDYIVIFFLSNTIFNIKQMLFGVVHKATYIFVGSTQLLVFVALKFNLFFLDGKLKAELFVFEDVVKQYIVHNIYKQYKGC